MPTGAWHCFSTWAPQLRPAAIDSRGLSVALARCHSCHIRCGGLGRRVGLGSYGRASCFGGIEYTGSKRGGLVDRVATLRYAECTLVGFLDALVLASPAAAQDV